MLRSYISALESGEDVIQKSLETIRRHFGMDVAYLSEFVDGRSVFRRIDAPGLEDMVRIGDSYALDDVYCSHIIAGRLPKLIPNTARNPLARSMPITSAIPIGAHMSIPIRLTDGTLYGNFCCLSREPNDSLNERDLGIMEMFANLAARQLSRETETRRRAEEDRARISDVIEQSAFDIVYQPICAITPFGVTGYEALCRFRREPYQSPDIWFSNADAVGLGADLELAAFEKALGALDRLPPPLYLSVNVSPATITSGRLRPLLDTLPLDRLVLEVTEHDSVSDYSNLVDTLAPLRAAGLRLAVDDTGAGYSSLQHIVQIAPDLIKLDMSLTQRIDTDPARRALASALIFFARETGAQLVAEGVETQAELDTLRLLGVNKAQGYLLGRPGLLPRQAASGPGADAWRPDDRPVRAAV